MGRLPSRLPVYPFGDNEKLQFGAGKDTSLYWDGTSFVIDDASSTRAFIIDNATADYVTLRGEATHLVLMPAATGIEYPNLKLSKDDHCRLYLKAAKSFYIYEEGTKIFDFAYASDIPTITASVTNDDIQFIPNGTGRVRFGAYVSGAATDSTGYIEIKDAGGTTRKVMIQA